VVSHLESVLQGLSSRFGDVRTSEFRGKTRIVIGAESLFEVMKLLKSDYGFDYLVDITCVDYLAFRYATDRFGLVYELTNTKENVRLTVRSFLNEPKLEIDSVVPLWAGANWMEREVYDMFGIVFVGHPDLRRILLPEEFTSFPLRKDYPLQGRGERHNFPVIRRAEA
jgi:NADH-quinone oxidoreductase subunit C